MLNQGFSPILLFAQCAFLTVPVPHFPISHFVHIGQCSHRFYIRWCRFMSVAINWEEHIRVLHVMNFPCRWQFSNAFFTPITLLTGLTEHQLRRLTCARTNYYFRVRGHNGNDIPHLGNGNTTTKVIVLPNPLQTSRLPSERCCRSDSFNLSAPADAPDMGSKWLPSPMEYCTFGDRF